MASVGGALGVGSGLDLTTLLNNLMAAEQQPLTKLQAQEASVQTQVSAYGQLSSALSSLRDSVKNLTPDSFNSTASSSSDKSIATVTTQNGAATGGFSLEVTKLAQAEKTVSRTLAADTKVAAGTLRVTLGTVSDGEFQPSDNGEPIDIVIDPGKNSLDDVRDAINAAQAGVTATVVNDDSGARLMLSSSKTGAGAAFRIEGTSDAGGAGEPLSTFNYDPAAAVDYDADSPAAFTTRLQAAGDAVFKIDGLRLTSPTNTVDGAVTGVKLTLVKAGTTQISITQDTSGTKKALQGLVDAYNSFLKTANQLSLNNPSATKGEASTGNGPLAGDSLVRDVMTRLRNGILDPVSGVDAEYTTLSSLGISFQSDGTLTLDSAQLDKALARDPSAAARLFGTGDDGTPTGVGARLVAQIGGFVDDDGAIDARVDGLGLTTKSLQKQEEELNDRLTQIEAQYRQQFTSLDSLLTNLNNTGNFLTQQLDALAQLRG
ncbi:flagellar filament capping protein FliD [Pigmentiphaga soli]|uniref:Flagellar hook-associated protein 2 n=1 Tax=Pigmentiphaga soli TaxID=1007095 RepID=A0ABP8HPT6_9BURK